MGAASLESIFRRYADSRDESAARELVARTRPRLLAIARRIGDPGDAEDSVQTAYLSLLHKREGDFGAPVLAWLVTATVRIAYRAKAQRQRMTEIARLLVRPPHSDTPAAHAGAADEARLLRDRVTDLPASLRDPVVLHYFQGLSADETGQLLGLSRDAVKKRLQRARAVLRSRWGPRLGSWLLVLPWWCADTAAAVAGGVVMKKTVVIAGLLVALAATAIGIALRSGSRAVGEQPSRSSLSDRRVGEASNKRDAVRPAAGETEVSAHSGVVVTPDGTPVEGATVRIGAYYWKTGGRMAMIAPFQPGTRTDGRGRFTLEPRYKDNVTAVEYQARAEGFVWTAVRCSLGERARIVLRKGGTLLVYARRAEDGSPVPRAYHVLRRSAPRGFEDFLSALGAEARFDLPPGAYQVGVSATGLAPSRQIDVDVEADSAQELTVALTTGVIYRVQVFDPDGRAVENAEVHANGPGRSQGFAKTDRSGRCRIGGIALPHTVGERPFVRVSFRVEAEGFAPYLRSVRLPDTEGEELVRLELSRGAPVAFRFRGLDGKPLVKQRVYFFYHPSEPPSLGQQLWRTTDPSGEIVFPALARGSILVQVREIEKHPRKIELTGKPQEVAIDLHPGEHEVTGRVLGPDGGPVDGGFAKFVPAARRESGPGVADRVPVAEGGSFRLAGLRAGEGDVWVWARGFGAQDFPARAPSDGVEIRLQEERPVGGIVVTRESKPVPEVPVRLERYFREGWTEMGTVLSDADGLFAFRGVGGDGRLQVRVDRDGGWIESHGLGHAVEPGDTSVRLTVKPKAEGYGLKIPLEVADSSGRPLHGRLQLAYSRDGKPGPWHLSPERTTTPGRFLLQYYDAPGSCDFRFSMPGYLSVQLPGVVIADKAQQPTLRLVFDRGAALTVDVRYADGSPVIGASLQCGDMVARTDARGRAEFGGFRAGARRVEIHKPGDYFLHSGSVEVELPGRVEVALARRGVVIGRAEGQGPFAWRLVDAEEVVRDARTTQLGWVRLFSTVGGAHRLVVTCPDGTREHDIEVRVGDSVAVGRR